MDLDRYTRLKAIKEFGYDIDWDDIKQYHLGIIGVGGLGSVTAEMAARCGVGHISIFDLDEVEAVNLNRLFYKPRHVGMLKVEAAKKILNEINPDVEISAYATDIMNMDFEATFEDIIQDFDLILNGLDNIPARDYLNIKCVKHNITYIDAGVSRSGLSGYIHPIVPHKTACAACLSRFSIQMPKERGEPCTASLPSTMAIIAGLQIQEMLKYFMKFAKVIDYLMYNMLSGEFFHYTTVRNTNCPICGDYQVMIKEIETRDVDEKELEDLIKELEDLR